MAPSKSNLNNSPILKLNDVCLKKVFQLLHLQELCNAAEVCQRFKQNADEVFKSMNTNLDIGQLIEGNKDYHDEWFMVRWLSEKFLRSAEQLFRNFGRFIKGLRLTGTGRKDGMDENELLTLVKTYCPSLKQLILHDIGKDDAFSIELLPLFAGLEKLSVFAGDVCDSFVAILSECHDLKYLNVCGVPATMWMNHKFPKLETLDISNNWEFDYTEFESFLKFHGNLRTLRYDNAYIHSDLFAMISKGLLKLETFCCNVAEMCDYDEEVEEVEENILQLSKLKSLRNLTFMCDASSLKLLVDAFEKENTPIEHFEIFECQIDSELIVGLSKLKSMKTLKLTQCEMAEQTLIDLTKHLNRLEEVIIKDIKEFDLDNYKDKLLLAENVRVVNSLKKLVRKRTDQDQGSADILNILNDDCLMEIFEFLPLPDLCNLADVCQRFQQNVQTVFKLHHTCFKTDEITKTDDDGFVHTDIQVAEQLFRNFGFFIQELSLKGRYLRNDIEQESILYLANKYCISLSFHTLTLDRINIKGPMRWIFPLLDLFYHLHKLELHSCQLDATFGKFISVCQIPTIQVFSSYGSTKWMDGWTFWHLRDLILLDIFQPESAMNEFIKLNGHLRSLVIHQSNLSSQIFKTVANHMPELRAFCFAGKNPKDRKTRKNVLHLARLKSLTNLTLNCEFFSVKHLIGEFVKEAIPISELNISFGTVDMELIEKLVNLKSLKSLQLRRVKMNKASLIDLVKKLPDLNELDIDIKGIGVNEITKMLQFAENLTKLKIGSERSHVQIDVVDYQSILGIVKSRKKAIKLCIIVNSENRKIFVPRYLLQQSSYWLKIENEIIENLSLLMSDSDSDTELGDGDSSVEESDDDSVMLIEGSNNDIDMEE